MFYSQFILAKNGPLGTIWIAAHLERKLRKNQVNETDINLSVESILFPEAPIALRLSGHLLLGVVRIYARKVNYLYQDCNETLVKIKHAFGSGTVDLPPDGARAPFSAITLPETFDFNDAPLIPHQEKFHRDVDLYVTERDQITLHDPLKESFFLAPTLELGERFEKEEHGAREQDKELLSFIPQMERTPLMQTLEEDVLPPMAIDMELDGNLEVNVEVSFPDWMDRDEHHIASPTLMVIDQTPVHVSTSILLEQEKLNISETGSLEAVKQAVMADKDVRADDVPEVVKLRSLVEPTIYGTNASRLSHETLIRPNSSGPTSIDESSLLKEDELPQQIKEHAHEGSSVSPYNGVAGPLMYNVAAIPQEEDVLTSILEVTPVQAAVMPVPICTIGNKRKRKHSIDTPTVIPNEFMKWQTKNTDDLRRSRKKPFSSSDKIWRSENDHYKKNFPKASIHGICPQLHELYDQMTVIKKTYFSPSAGSPVSPESVLCTPHVGVDAIDRVYRSLDHADGENQNFIVAETRNDLQLDTNKVETMRSRMVASVSVGIEEVTVSHHAPETDAQQQPTISEQGQQPTPRTQKNQIVQNLDSREGIEVAAVTPVDESSERGLSLLADLSLENGELLDEMYVFQDSRNLSACTMGRDYNGWSERTRSIAQFLQEAFKTGKVGGYALQEQQFHILSLNEMLKNKIEKQAARLFFEILVLKSQDYIGAEQEGAYSDISISARPKLAKAAF